MQESYGEGSAHLTDLESCRGDSNVMAEALTEESTGQPLNSEISFFRVPTMFSDLEGNMECSVMCKLHSDSAES